MSDQTRTIVTEEWRWDALRVVIFDPYARRVAKVTAQNGVPPILRMEPYATAEDGLRDADDDQAGILLPYEMARLLYEALGRHFGDHQDPASRELVDSLGSRLLTEELRVDKMLDRLLAMPTTIINGGEVRVVSPPPVEPEDKTDG